MEGADTQHGSLRGVDVAADDTLPGDDNLAGDEGGVDGLMGQRAVAALTGDGQLEDAGAGPERTGLDDGLVERQAVPEVQPERGGWRGRVHDAGADHGGGPAEALFGRLEDQLDATRQRRLTAHEQLRDAHADGSVAVVPTGVHDAVVLRGEGQAGLFADGQGVHVEAQEHGGRVVRRVVALDDGDDAGRGDAGADLKPQPAQVVGHDAGGTHLVEAQLRVTMEIAPPSDQLGGERLALLM